MREVSQIIIFSAERTFYSFVLYPEKGHVKRVTTASKPLYDSLNLSQISRSDLVLLLFCSLYAEKVPLETWPFCKFNIIRQENTETTFTLIMKGKVDSQWVALGYTLQFKVLSFLWYYYWANDLHLRSIWRYKKKEIGNFFIVYSIYYIL